MGRKKRGGIKRYADIKGDIAPALNRLFFPGHQYIGPATKIAKETSEKYRRLKK